MPDILQIAIGASALALLFAFAKYSAIMKRSAGSEKMQEISKAIQDGAAAFLKAEYRWLTVFVIVVAAAILVVCSAVVACILCKEKAGKPVFTNVAAVSKPSVEVTSPPA